MLNGSGLFDIDLAFFDHDHRLYPRDDLRRWHKALKAEHGSQRRALPSFLQGHGGTVYS